SAWQGTPRRTGLTYRLARCAASARRCWPGPARCRSGSVRCSLRGSAGCQPRTGLVASAAQIWCLTDMSHTSGRRGAGKRPGSAATPPSARRGGADQRGRSGPGAKAQRYSTAGRSGPDRVRRTAGEVLLAVGSNDAYANLLLSASLRERGLRGQDAALATELVYGTLRNRSCYDAVISLCADRGLDQIDPPVLAVLRLGTHQLLGMRIKAHAAVATAVDLAIAFSGRRPAGFVNAVLRKIATRELEWWMGIVAPDRVTDRTGHLAIRYSHPRWIVAALADAAGESVPDMPQAGPGQADADQGLPRTEAVLAADQDRPAVT